MKVLLSIKPEFVREIFAGNKKFEYRKIQNGFVFKLVIFDIIINSKCDLFLFICIFFETFF